MCAASVIDANFDASDDGFTYVDDTFRGTSEPGFADGGRVTTGGTGNSASLQMALGGVDDIDIFAPGMSGGFETGFTLSEVSDVSLSFFYRLDMSGSYEPEEFSEVLVSLDDGSTTTLFGQNGEDFIDRLFGDAGAATPREVSEDTVTLDLGTLAAGTYTVTLGGRNNQKTTTSEDTLITFDDVLLEAETTGTGNTPPVAQDDRFGTNEDTPIAGGNVLADNGDGPDSDDDGDTLTVTAVNGQAGDVGQAIDVVSLNGRTGQVTIAANGDLTFDPLGNFQDLGAGDIDVPRSVDGDAVLVDYTVDDGNGGTDTATVEILIDGVNDAPTQVVNDGATVASGGTVVIGAADLAFADVDNTAAELTYTVTTAPAGGEVRLNGNPTTSFTQADLDAGLVSYAHGGGAGSADGFVFSLSDGDEGTVAGQTFDITVAGPASTLIDADFSGGNDGFTYVDDAFRGTGEPGFADGGRVTSGGTGNSPALQMALGGVDDVDIFAPGMSGGFETGFTLSQATEVSLSFFYRLDMSGSYEPEEFSEVLVSLDDGSTTTLFGRNGNDFIDRLFGDGGAATPRVISEDTVTLDLGTLEAGTYTLTLGGRNNQKTTTSEETLITFDDVLLQGAADGPTNTAPMITSAATVSVPENQTAAIDVAATDDHDAEGAGLSYAITGGADAGLFGIDPATGEVTFNTAPDFEAPGDANTDNAYEVQVTVTDSGTLTDVQDITVTVTDATELPQPPATLANLDGTNGFALGGPSTSASRAGDVNGDGFEDVIVSDSSGANVDSFVTVLFGQASDFESLNSFSQNSDASFGFSVSGGGDLDGDGLADAIVGNPAGSRAIALFGQTVDFGTVSSAITGTPGSELGTSVSDAGDMNGDGFADLIVSELYGGQSYVVFGTASGFGPSLDVSTLDGSNGFAITGPGGGDTVSAIGDINGDGFADVATGNAVVFGRGTGFAASVDTALLEGTDGFTIAGGSDASQAGDVNGDGIADLIVGTKVVFGRTSGFGAVLDVSSLNGTDGFGFVGGDGVASAVAAGDVNGDGIDDVVVSAPLADGGPDGQTVDAGGAYLVFGRTSGFGATFDLGALSPQEGFFVAGDGETFSLYAGRTVAQAGDFNGDGFADIVIGAHFIDAPDDYPSVLVGNSYIVFGGDFTGAVTGQGDDGANTLTGSAAADVLLGAQGNDTLVGIGGPDVLIGGEGDDLLAISDDGPQRVKGGTGTDTLRLDGAGFTFDLTAIPDLTVTEIERIDLRAGTGSHSLILDVLEVLNLSNTSNTLTVLGDAADAVAIGGGWTSQGTANGFETFTQGAATLVIDTDIAVSGPNAPPAITSAAAVSVAENQTAAIDVEATDDNDAEGAGLSYALTGGADAALFGIDAVTGEVTFNTAPDFEAPGDANTDNDYEIQVTVTDSGNLTDVQDITVTVTDVAENTGSTLIDADFGTGTDGFTYVDDAFRGTTEPGFADGSRVTSGGAGNSPALQMALGGVDDVDIFAPGMSGGFETGFTLSEATEVSLSFFYRLDLSGSYEPEEFSEVLVSLDDGSTTTLFGRNGNDFIDRLFGDGGAATPRDVSEDTVTLDLGTLEAGTYTLTLGGRNNQKTTTSEDTLITFDDVLLQAASGGPANRSPVAQDDFIEYIAGQDPTGNVLADNGNGPDSDPDGDAIFVQDRSFFETDGGNHYTIATNGDFLFYPQLGFTGTDSFNYDLFDGQAADTGTVTISVAMANTPPVAQDDAFATDEDTAIAAGNVLADNGNGPDDDADSHTLTVFAVDGQIDNVGQTVNLVSTGGRTGQITIAADGGFSFDPLGNFQDLGLGDSDAVAVGYTIDDGNAGLDSAVATVTVNGVNDAPTLTVNDGATVASGGTVVIGAADLAFADVDNTAAELTYTVTTAPAGGEVRLNGSPATSFTQADLDAGLVSYAHGGGTGSADGFVFSLSDGDGGTVAGQTFDITVVDGGFGRIEAEDYAGYFDLSAGNNGGAYRTDDVDIEVTSDTGGGFNVGWIEAGEWLTYPITVPEAGVYAITARVAALNAGPFSLKASVDGAETTLTFDGTGGHQTWTDVTGTLNLPASVQTLRLDALSTGFNLNWVEFSATGTAPPLIDADFGTGADGFTYVDDTFRGTSEPGFADGGRVTSGGTVNSPALQMALGGVDDVDIFAPGMSGGFETGFTLSQATEVSLSFFYRLDLSGSYEPEEFSEVLVSLDDGSTTTLFGRNGSDFIDRLFGDGGAATPREVSEDTVALDLGTLAAGTYTLTLGGRNNQKTTTSEDTLITFDDVLLQAASGGPANTAPMITSAATVSVPENQTAAIDVAATDDHDAEGSGLTYAITGGADAGLFGIDPATGAVTFNAAPDFEAPGDANTDNAYEVQVTVADSGTLTDVQDITVMVTDETELPQPPASLADLDGTNGFVLSRGATRSASGAGDVDGDGFEDVVAGIPQLTTTDGTSFVVFGKSNGFETLSTATLAEGLSAGFSASGVGDANGDGLAEAIVGVPAGSTTSVFFGQAANFGTDSFTIVGATGANLGNSVSGAGDVNGDGFADMIAAADAFTYGGVDESYVVFGNGSGFGPSLNVSTLDGTNGFVISGPGGGERVSDIGDINGDGFADVMTGNAVIFGGGSGFGASIDTSTLDGSNGFTIAGVTRGSGAGDVNGDGIGDLIVGNSSGATYVLLGHTSGFGSVVNVSSLNGTNGFAVVGDSLDGGDFAGAGDVDGDGLDDMIFGAPEADGGPDGQTTDAGGAYVVFGRASGFGSELDVSTLPSDQGSFIAGEGLAYNLHAGDPVSAAGDVNGDGFADIIIGSYFVDAPPGYPSVIVGSSYVIFGNDFSGAVDQQGDDGADTLTGTASGEVLIGAQGDDTLVGNGGPDVLYGGQGDDVLAIADTSFQRLNGGTGTDTLRLDGSGLTLDLTAIPDLKLEEIERIDLQEGSGAHTLTLDLLEVLNLSNTSNTLTVLGDGDDGVTIADLGDWTSQGIAGGFETFTQGTAILVIDEDILIT